MSSIYRRAGNKLIPTDSKNIIIEESLPVGNYVVRFDPDNGFFFEEVESFTASGKRYGKNPIHTQRILDTFMSRENATGVMLVGEKGSGKSLLAKTVSIGAAEMGIPTLIINSEFCGDNFNKFIQGIKQPCVVIFDEFEKVYDSEAQESLLTLLDGVFPTKKLFVLTCNLSSRVDDHLRNRPGRIFYLIEFKGLEEQFIREYCEDNLSEKSHIETIVNIFSVMGKSNFDMLKALVEEMNRYGEDPKEAIKLLNAKPVSCNDRYTVTLEINGVQFKVIDGAVMVGNPAAKENHYVSWFSEEKDEDGDFIMKGHRITQNEMVSYSNGEYKYQWKEGDNIFVASMNREYGVAFDAYDLF